MNQSCDLKTTNEATRIITLPLNPVSGRAITSKFVASDCQKGKHAQRDPDIALGSFLHHKNHEHATNSKRARRKNSEVNPHSGGEMVFHRKRLKVEMAGPWPYES